MVIEDGMTMSGGHSMQHTDPVSQECALETCMTLLIRVTPIKFLKGYKKLG